MFAFDVVTAYLLIVGLLTLLIVVLVWQRQRAQKPLAVWLSAALLGVVLGSVGSYGVMRTMGFQLARAQSVVDLPPSVTAIDAPVASAASMGGSPMSGGAPGAMGMGGGMGGGRPGMGGPRPKRDLASLVRKLDLLTGDIAVVLTSDQAAGLQGALADIEKAESLSDDDAQAKHDAILTLLDDEQKARLEKIGLPRPPRGMGGGPGGSGGPGGGMGGPPAEAENPFTGETESQALASLRTRLQPPAPADGAQPK